MKQKFNMKPNFLYISFLFFLSCGVKNIPMDQLNELQPVKLYATTLDFLNKQPMMVDAGALINNQSDQHITVKDFFNMETGQKISRAMSAWAVEYKEKNYFNLGYSTEVHNWKSFAKLDLEGKYCLTIIDDKSPKVFKHTNNSYLGGLSGYLATQISLEGAHTVGKTRDERKKPN